MDGERRLFLYPGFPNPLFLGKRGLGVRASDAGRTTAGS